MKNQWEGCAGTDRVRSALGQTSGVMLAECPEALEGRSSRTPEEEKIGKTLTWPMLLRVLKQQLYPITMYHSLTSLICKKKLPGRLPSGHSHIIYQNSKVGIWSYSSWMIRQNWIFAPWVSFPADSLLYYSWSLPAQIYQLGLTYRFLHSLTCRI